MSKGVPYEKALVEADRAERKERRRAGDIRPTRQAWPQTTGSQPSPQMTVEEA